MRHPAALKQCQHKQEGNSMARQLEQTRNESRASEQASERQAQGQGAADRLGAAARDTARNVERTAQEAERAMRETQQRLQDGAREFSAMGERAIEAIMRSNQEALGRVLELNREFATWSRAQLDHGIDAVRSMAQVRTVGAAYDVQLGLLRAIMENSMRHGSIVFDLAARTMMDGMQIPQQVRQHGSQRGQQPAPGA
jgi:hypothetical protein